MKILVAFYSKTGKTKRVAENVAKALSADIDEIIDQRDRNGIKGWLLGGRDGMKESLTEIKTKKDPEKYDLVIVGTPVWAWNITPAVRTYVTKFRKNIKRMAVLVTAGSSKPEKTVSGLEKIWGKKVEVYESWVDDDFDDNEKCLKKTNEFLEKVKGIRS
ncbi:MAG: flavodoxin [Bacteriovorax sp.]|nr:flavodoxin [Bacteriovorax sp.]